MAIRVSSHITVYLPGSKVTTRSGVEVLILEVHIQSLTLIEYECVWWKDGARTKTTLRDFELNYLLDQPMLEVGFHACLHTESRTASPKSPHP